MALSPASFSTAARQRGWPAMLKILARVVDADRVLLLAAETPGTDGEELPFFALQREGASDYIERSEMDSSLDDLLADCHAVLVKRAPVRREENGRLAFYGIPLFADQRLVAALGVAGPRLYPLSETQSEILSGTQFAVLDDVRAAISESFPSPRDMMAIRDPENSLDELNRRFKIAMEMANVVFWTMDGDRVIHWPQLNVSLKSLRHLLGRRHSLPVDRFIERIIPEDRETIHRALLDTAHGIPVRDCVYRLRIGRTVRYLASWLHPILNDRGEVVGCFGLTQDVTDAKRMEQELREANNRFKMAVTLGQMGFWRIDFQAGRMEVSEELQLLTGFSSPSILLKDLVHRVVPADQEPLREALRRIEEGEEADLSLRVEKNDTFVHYQVVGFPIHDDRGGVKTAFGLLQDISRQKKLEEELAEANRWLSNAMAIGHMGYWKIEWSRDKLTASLGLRKILGINRSEVDLHSLVAQCIPKDRSTLLEAFKSLSRGSEIDFSYKCLVGEQVRDIFVCGFPICDAGGFVRSAFGISQDVTEMRKLEARLQNYFDTAHSLILSLDSDFRITYANPYVGELLGYDTADLIGWDGPVVLIPERGDDSSPSREQIRNEILVSEKSHFHYINENLHLDDSIVWVSWMNVITRDEAGRISEILCIGNDITSLKAVQSRFDLAVHGSGLGFWDINIPADHGIASPLWFDIRGVAPDTPLTYELFYDAIHPDDGPSLRRAVADHFNGLTEIVEARFRLWHPVRGWLWIRTKGKVTQRGTDGRPLWFTGFDSDVTREIVDEENIRNSRNLIQQAMELGRMGYWVYDFGQQRIVSHSATLFSLFGLPDNQFVDWKNNFSALFKKIVHPDDFHDFSARYDDRSDEDNGFTFRILMPTGMIAFFFLHSTPIADAEGRVVSRITVVQDITDQKIVETALIEREKEIREKELRYRRLFDNSNDAIHVIDGEVITECNRRTLEIYGYANHEEFLVLRPTDLAAEFQADGRRSAEWIDESFEQCRDGLQVGPLDWISRRKDGSTFESSVSLVPLPGERLLIQVIVHDVAERRAAARALENYRAYISLLAEIRKSFYSRSEQEIVQTFLETATEFFNLEKAWFGIRIGNTIRPVFHAGKAKGFIDVPRIEIEPPTGSPRFPLIEAITEYRCVAINNLDTDPGFEPWREFVHSANVHSALAIPMEMNERIEGGVVFYSVRHNAFDESIIDYLNSGLKELVRISAEKRRWSHQQRTLKKAKETAEAAAKAKSQFLANMSHEIRTPMTSILGYTEVLLRDHLAQTDNMSPSELNPELCLRIIKHCKSTAGVIQSNAEFLLSILNDILDFSKIEAGKMTLEMRDVSLSRFLGELLSLYDVQAKKKNLGFSVHALTPLPEVMFTDPVRSKQILINLIGNAIKFTSKGEVVVSVAWVTEDGPGILPPQDATSEHPFRGNLFFSVKDTGIGIAAHQLHSLFTPFHQADDSMTRRFGGTGLGLAISKRLVQLLGGDLTCSSQEGVGSTFTVMLPQQLDHEVSWKAPEDISINVPADSSGITGAVSFKTSPGRPLSGLRILLAEDGKDNQRLFSFILDKAGAEVQVADNGRIALNLVLEDMQKNARPFDVVLMDMQMPVMDGYTATQEMRKAGYANPVIALTAHALVEERQKCIDAGCNDYATKPILRDALIAVILKNAGK